MNYFIYVDQFLKFFVYDSVLVLVHLSVTRGTIIKVQALTHNALLSDLSYALQH